MARLCSINALIVPVVLVIVLRIPVSLDISTANFLRLTAIYLASAVPFFITGLEFSVLFAREAKHVSPLYAADLARRRTGLPRHCPAAELAGRPQYGSFHRRCMAHGRNSVGRSNRKARNSALPGASSSWP